MITNLDFQLHKNTVWFLFHLIWQLFTTNLYRDIATDIAAEHQGGLGQACSSNIRNKYAMFKAIYVLSMQIRVVSSEQREV